jgi:ribonuclease HII
MASIAEFLDKSVAELEQLLAGRHRLPPGLLEALENDPRRGARILAHKIRSTRLANRREACRLHRLERFEEDLWAQGVALIAGIDEAGVSPLAGPVVAGAVILPRKCKIRGLNDSKKIPTEARRDDLAFEIKKKAVCWAFGRAEVEEIDSLNIYHAALLAMRRALEGLNVKPEFVLVDARRIPHCPYPQRGIIHGDALSASIAAASLIAKTTRDACMIELHKLYPGYGFADHKGYPTAEHRRLLKELGACPVHRKSYALVRQALGLDPLQGELFETTGKGNSNHEDRQGLEGPLL